MADSNMATQLNVVQFRNSGLSPSVFGVDARIFMVFILFFLVQRLWMLLLHHPFLPFSETTAIHAGHLFRLHPAYDRRDAYQLADKTHIATSVNNLVLLHILPGVYAGVFMPEMR